MKTSYAIDCVVPCVSCGGPIWCDKDKIHEHKLCSMCLHYCAVCGMCIDKYVDFTYSEDHKNRPLCNQCWRIHHANKGL